MIHLSKCLSIVSTCVVIFLTSGCGSYKNLRTKTGSNSKKTTQVSIHMLTSPNTPFSYTARIEGCDSGFSENGLTEANTTVDVPLGDQNCVFKIDSMTVGGVVYNPGGSETWGAGDSYMWANGTNRLRLAVVDVLDALIQGAQSVQINFSVSINGSDVVVAPTTEASIDISESSAISLEVTNVATTVSGAGAGQFVFTLACDVAVAGTSCDDVDMSGLKSSLIVDTTGSIDIDSCLTEINANGQAVTPFATDPNAPNGGATTAQHVGPAPMYAPANRDLMLLVSDGVERCKYYKVQITLP
jgi:hypothetical protein